MYIHSPSWLRWGLRGTWPHAAPLLALNDRFPRFWLHLLRTTPTSLPHLRPPSQQLHLSDKRGVFVFFDGKSPPPAQSRPSEVIRKLYNICMGVSDEKALVLGRQDGRPSDPRALGTESREQRTRSNSNTNIGFEC
ncbi:hypothetical protein FIBSPDRAFT_470752 [Athelia psychrophila]|uniref:Uncharacterized protein n=1 Tax=Athelia psychrophila TaxID=1759441 RepID=A0A167U0P9_9AGAM|nr:hypothetical protein FIBSPDRAFT_470752 [Fibularhizoctonia sp. CBS 109695]